MSRSALLGGTGRDSGEHSEWTRRAESRLGEPTKQNAGERRARLGPRRQAKQCPKDPVGRIQREPQAAERELESLICKDERGGHDDASPIANDWIGRFAPVRAMRDLRSKTNKQDGRDDSPMGGLQDRLRAMHAMGSSKVGRLRDTERVISRMRLPVSSQDGRPKVRGRGQW